MKRVYIVFLIILFILPKKGLTNQEIDIPSPKNLIALKEYVVKNNLQLYLYPNTDWWLPIIIDTNNNLWAINPLEISSHIARKGSGIEYTGSIKVKVFYSPESVKKIIKWREEHNLPIYIKYGGSGMYADYVTYEELFFSEIDFGFDCGKGILNIKHKIDYDKSLRKLDAFYYPRWISFSSQPKSIGKTFLTLVCNLTYNEFSAIVKEIKKYFEDLNLLQKPLPIEIDELFINSPKAN